MPPASSASSRFPSRTPTASSCFDQDQELDRVDFACLRQRQNGAQEKIGALWIDRSLGKVGFL
jgi:hypothetical protein